jgi:hypothetical protein
MEVWDLSSFRYYFYLIANSMRQGISNVSVKKWGLIFL